jgi:hypothetical protein
MKMAVFILFSAIALSASKESTRAYLRKQWAGMPQVSVRQLAAASHNEVCFDQRYKGKHMIIYGYVDNVERIDNDSAVLWLKPNRYEHLVGRVAAAVDPVMVGLLVVRNYNIAIDCTIHHLVMGNIVAIDCRDAGIPEWMPKPVKLP